MIYESHSVWRMDKLDRLHLDLQDSCVSSKKFYLQGVQKK